ncbi:MAG: hypothetical protein HY518_05205 [Candidatus Aenigmarchaeota archaeon]|nr:hypothetical protein [Candidatus Aenigmarchaeota archaeon]
MPEKIRFSRDQLRNRLYEAATALGESQVAEVARNRCLDTIADTIANSGNSEAIVGKFIEGIEGSEEITAGMGRYRNDPGKWAAALYAIGDILSFTGSPQNARSAAKALSNDIVYNSFAGISNADTCYYAMHAMARLGMIAGGEALAENAANIMKTYGQRPEVLKMAFSALEHLPWSKLSGRAMKYAIEAVYDERLGRILGKKAVREDTARNMLEGVAYVAAFTADRAAVDRAIELARVYIRKPQKLGHVLDTLASVSENAPDNISHAIDELASNKLRRHISGIRNNEASEALINAVGTTAGHTGDKNAVKAVYRVASRYRKRPAMMKVAMNQMGGMAEVGGPTGNKVREYAEAVAHPGFYNTVTRFSNNLGYNALDSMANVILEVGGSGAQKEMRALLRKYREDHGRLLKITEEIVLASYEACGPGRRISAIIRSNLRGRKQ